MDLRILKTQPFSGEYTEYNYGSGAEFTSVLIEKKGYDKYCGNFSNGVCDFSKVVSIDNVAFIIAKGRGYLLDVNSREILLDTLVANFSEIYTNVERGLFIACTNTELYIYGRSELVWNSPRISSDGIRIEKIEEDRILGQIFDFMNWVDFELKLEKFVFVCDWKFPEL